MKKSIKMFGREHGYEFIFEIERVIKVIEELSVKITQPFILSYDGLETVGNFYLKNDEDNLGDKLVWWLYDQTKDKTDTDGDIRRCILENSIEDVEWTTERNKNLMGIFYRKMTFKPNVQKLLLERIVEYKEVAEKAFSELKAEEEKTTAEKKERHKLFSIKKIYKHTLPKGGEDGDDGYFDADIIDTDSGETVRFITLDIFDGGKFSFPKRFEGKASENENWTEQEINIRKWLAEFSPFKSGIRM